MFREMRRKKQMLSMEEADLVLTGSTSGVLALDGDDGYPYAVPLSYVYDGSKIWFHCAGSGHKLDAIRRNQKASFCVIGRDEVVPEKYTTRYQSVIVFGRIRIVEEDREKREAIEKLALRYAPDDTAAGRARYIERAWEAFCILEMSIDLITGKQGAELLSQ